MPTIFKGTWTKTHRMGPENSQETRNCSLATLHASRTVARGTGMQGWGTAFFKDMATEGSGVTSVDLETGEEKLLVSHK